MKVTLNKTIYQLPAVQETVEAFEELARFEVSSTGNTIDVEIEVPQDSDADEVVDEFLNYALAESISRRG